MNRAILIVMLEKNKSNKQKIKIDQMTFKMAVE